ncbi:hypothetical protein G7Y31_07095 [Corynebacterium lizhenjunii]|uniref:Uncharacterized protein n=1 Tax=Corynebacterium lizhenjunii TaxID=2709394 RepID=A0A7T0KD81_9CORY|nr:hypothetical protein [Corynebacterium lizhenjunii]QPK78344.1 hypothetical protein G7Y31_07095 [Corynebacterium lizhenjunii]
MHHHRYRGNALHDGNVLHNGNALHDANTVLSYNALREGAIPSFAHSTQCSAISNSVRRPLCISARGNLRVLIECSTYDEAQKHHHTKNCP